MAAPSRGWTWHATRVDLRQCTERWLTRMSATKRAARRLRRRKRMKREHQINFWYVVIAVLAILTIQDLLLQANQIEEIPYSEFQSLASDNKLGDLVVGPTRITGAYKEP